MWWENPRMSVPPFIHSGNNTNIFLQRSEGNSEHRCLQRWDTRKWFHTILSNSNDLLDFLYLGSFDFEEGSCPSSSQPSAVWTYIVHKEWNPYFVHCVNTSLFFFFYYHKIPQWWWEDYKQIFSSLLIGRAPWAHWLSHLSHSHAKKPGDHPRHRQ